MLRTALTRCVQQAAQNAARRHQAAALATLAGRQPGLLAQAALTSSATPRVQATLRLAAPLVRSFAADPARWEEVENPKQQPSPATVVEGRGLAAMAADAQASGVPPASAGATGKTFNEGYIAPHAGLAQQDVGKDDYLLMHPVYTRDYVESVAPRHRVPSKVHEHIGYRAIQLVRSTFDLVTGYGPNKMTEAKWLQRIIFLETVAGVPGMVGGMLRHMKSLRTMTRDNGWIHTLLEEAENERMHLLTFLKIRQPGLLFRTMVLLGQGVFFNFYMLAYLLSPKTCHAAVGYLEEEAVKTYTHALHEIDAGKLWANTPAPDIAIKYWRLPESATMRDLILAVRADEAAHSHVNHTFSAMKPVDTNPSASASTLCRDQALTGDLSCNYCVRNN